MPRAVIAHFGTEEEAENALSAVAAEVPLRDSAVVGSGVSGALTLESMNLAPEERSYCTQQLSSGGFLLVAQVASESRREAVLRLLASAPPRAEPANAPPQGEPVAATPEVEDGAVRDKSHEERIPIVEEEVRIGKREVVRGRSQVHVSVAEVPVQEQVELLHEETHVHRRAVDRRISEEDVTNGGLLKERVIEITGMREEAVVSKETFVREELVVTKSVHRRVEQINETVRRTEVETKRLEPDEGPPDASSAERIGT